MRTEYDFKVHTYMAEKKDSRLLIYDVPNAVEKLK